MLKGGVLSFSHDCICMCACVQYDALLQIEVERLLVKENAIVTEQYQRDSVQSNTPGSISSMWRKKLSR